MVVGRNLFLFVLLCFVLFCFVWDIASVSSTKFPVIPYPEYWLAVIGIGGLLLLLLLLLLKGHEVVGIGR